MYLGWTHAWFVLLLLLRRRLWGFKVGPQLTIVVIDLSVDQLRFKIFCMTIFSFKITTSCVLEDVSRIWCVRFGQTEQVVWMRSVRRHLQSPRMSFSEKRRRPQAPPFAHIQCSLEISLQKVQPPATWAWAVSLASTVRPAILLLAGWQVSLQLLALQFTDKPLKGCRCVF